MASSIRSVMLPDMDKVKVGGISLITREVRSLSWSDTLLRERSQGLPRSLKWNGSDQQTSAVYRLARTMRTFPPMK
jgi:hypothetical protein